MKEDPPPALRIWKVGEIKGFPIFRITVNHYWSAFNWLEEQGISDDDFTYFNTDADFKKLADGALERSKLFFVDEKTWPEFLGNIEEKKHRDMVVYKTPIHFYGEIPEAESNSVRECDESREEVQEDEEEYEEYDEELEEEEEEEEEEYQIPHKTTYSKLVEDEARPLGFPLKNAKSNKTGLIATRKIRAKETQR